MNFPFLCLFLIYLRKIRANVTLQTPTEDTDVINVFESWEKNCPHVSDNPPYRKLVVTWQLDEAIWLKIDSGKALIKNRLTSINEKEIGGKHILRVVLNDRRYQFYYDELAGAFSLTIDPSRESDSGVWQCHVVIYSQNGNVEQRSSIRNLKVVGDSPGGGAFPTAVPTEKWREKEIIFERDDDSEKTVQFEQSDDAEIVSYDREDARMSASSISGLSIALLLGLYWLAQRLL